MTNYVVVQYCITSSVCPVDVPTKLCSISRVLHGRDSDLEYGRAAQLLQGFSDIASGSCLLIDQSGGSADPASFGSAEKRIQAQVRDPAGVADFVAVSAKWRQRLHGARTRVPC